MKVSKVDTYRPITITLETQDDYDGVKAILKYLQGREESFHARPCSSWGAGGGQRYNNMPDKATKAYHAINARL